MKGAGIALPLTVPLPWVVAFTGTVEVEVAVEYVLTDAVVLAVAVVDAGAADVDAGVEVLGAATVAGKESVTPACEQRP